VVKNVAGYDLLKLFVGGRGTLGIVTSATFKVRPLPEAETFANAPCESLDMAGKLMEAVLSSALTPVVLDLHNLARGKVPFTLVIGFAGSREEVNWQLGEARKLGFTEPETLGYDQDFRSGLEALHQRSVLPSRVCETLAGLNNVPFVARAGNGVIYHHGGPAPPKADLPAELMRRLKDTFDPRHILPELPW
jgi:glycolate oxidase FAD binding subunit